MKLNTSFSFQASSRNRRSAGSAWITGSLSMPTTRRAVFCHRVM